MSSDTRPSQINPPVNAQQPPELLAPAGNWDCAKAAVIHGADAIFFGLEQFNARMRADNFSLDDLDTLLPWLHERGVKGYVTLNTLIFPEELLEAEQLLQDLYQRKVDAVIVQDVGIAALAQRMVPNLRIHASTQMTITSPEGVAFAHELGVKQVVLARELSMQEMVKFGKMPAEQQLPLEVFVHGALCVAYSGQCLTSESLGQRSANRGECAQACRLPYELVIDGEPMPLDDAMGEKKYLLSPQDLAAVNEIPQLIDIGIKSFKIEGRLKNPDYVASVTQVYRKAIDQALDSKQKETRQDDGKNENVSAEDFYKLEMTFSRGLYTGWLHGVHHQELVHARFGKKRGPLAGHVIETGRDWVEVELQTTLNPGDGVVFDTGGDTENEQGGRLFELRHDPILKNTARLYFQTGKIDFKRLKHGHRVWKTDDPKLHKQIEKSLNQEAPLQKSPLIITVSGAVDQPLRLTGYLPDQKISVYSESEQPLAQARNRPLTTETLQKQLSRLGNTPYQLVKVQNELIGDLMLPISLLNQARRTLVDAITDAITQGASHQQSILPVKPIAADWLSRLTQLKREASLSLMPELSALCRTMIQVEAALECEIPVIYTDFEDIRGYKAAVECIQAHNQKHSDQQSTKVYLATPRIQKAGEQGYFNMIAKLEPDGVLVRNLGAIDWFSKTNLPLIGDFSLNVANALAASVFMEHPKWQARLERVTVSYDLNYRQVESLLESVPGHWLEITLHQHMPMFHMEHCVFAAFLSEGKDFHDCGRPCEKHEVRMKDRLGSQHPLKADVGCRNTVYHEKAQSGASYIQGFKKNGARHFRIELLDEDMVKSKHVLENYQQLINERISPKDLRDALKVHHQLGVTQGTLTVLN